MPRRTGARSPEAAARSRCSRAVLRPPIPRSTGSSIARSCGVAVSELALGAPVRKWTLIARNRIIAALSELTVVVQGRERSGALSTAQLARKSGCRVGAVPGSVFVPQSEGPHMLLREGAILVRSPQDVLDAVCGLGTRIAVDPIEKALSDDGRAV